MLKSTRPPTLSSTEAHKPGPGRVPVPNGNYDTNQLARQPPAPNNNPLDTFFDQFRKPKTPRSRSEERTEALIQKHERRQKPIEYVVPELKWGYTIMYVESADIILDDEDLSEKATKDRSFADRKTANEYLDKKTSPNVVGGLEAIVSRNTTLEGPERLLKVDIELTNGEHHLMWVERGMVVLSDLKEDKRRQAQWKATPRPKIPHYVVACELIRYGFRHVTGPGNDEVGEPMSVEDQLTGTGPVAVSVESVEKLPLESFTIREMANERAGKLLLENSKIDSRFAEPADITWWKFNAIPEHKRAKDAARKPGGVYEAVLLAYDMNDRFGWDQLHVNVHEVDDITGPVNF